MNKRPSPEDVAVVAPLADLLESMAKRGTLAPARRKPGPAPGTPATGHRQKEPYQPGQYTFWSQWQLWPASTRPTNKTMAAALGCHPQTFARKMSPDNRGRGLSPEELAAGNALLMAL